MKHIFKFLSMLAIFAIAISLAGTSASPAHAAATWTNAASMNIPRTNGTATMLPTGKVLVAGGVNHSGYVAAVETYDPATNTWTLGGSLNTARDQHTATILPNGKILLAGGISQFGILGSTEIYDPDTNTLNYAAPLSITRFGHTATLLPNGKLLVAGGVGGVTNNILTNAEVYELSTNTWTPVASMNNARTNHTATLLPNGKVLVASGHNNLGATVTAEVYDPGTNTWTNVASLNTGRFDYHTATLLPDGKVLIVGGTNGSALSNAEVYDPGTDTWTNVASLNAARYNFQTVLLPSGKVLVVGGYNGSFLNSAEVYDPGTNTWTNVASLNTARVGHREILLPDGRLLVTGGNDSSSIFTSAEVYDDPSAGIWTNAPSLNVAHGFHTATLLQNGKVLVAGGQTTGGNPTTVIEMYDPNANSWTNVAPWNNARVSHTATLLPDGNVLITGGWWGSYSTGTDIYNPNANQWINAASLNTARSGHQAILMPGGEVLVVGGQTTGGNPTGVVEMYDPGTNTWTNVAGMNTARSSHTATLLADGKVLVTGGIPTGCAIVSAEIYDPNTNTWTNVANLNAARMKHTATLLPNGKVIVTGGEDNCGGGYLTSVEVYDPAANTWTSVTSLNAARYFHSANLLPNGKVLVAGGYGYVSPPYLASVEVYDPIANTWTTVAPLSNARVGHGATILPNGKLLVTGGNDNSGYLNSVQVYDAGLGFAEVWRPTLNTLTSPLTLGNSLSLTGFGYRGYLFTEASSGGSSNSATNVPLVQIRRLDNEQWLWVAPSSFNNTTFASLPVTDILAGPAILTVFVNGIPSLSQPMNLNYATSASLDAPGITYNSNGTVTVTVTSANAIPLGVVTLSVDGGAPTSQHLIPVYGSSPLQATATFTLTTPAAGNHTLNAAYAAQNNFAASSAGGSLHVTQAATSTAVGSSTNPSSFGQTVTFIATVTSGAGTPAGTVTFMDGATVLGTTALSGGIAAFNTATLATGPHAITATYNGDLNYSPSAAALSGGQTVDASNVVVLLASSPSPIPFGQTATFTATVGISGVHKPLREAATTCILSGTVTFHEGASTLGSANVDDNCQAVFSTATLAAGTHNITAQYSGDANYGSGTSNTSTMVVNAIGTNTSVASSLNPSTPGQSVTFTATVSPTPDGGTVTFKDGSADISGCIGLSLMGGQAACNTSALANGMHLITAGYSGTANYAASTGTLTPDQQVNGSPILSLSAATHNFGDQVVGAASGVFTITITNTGTANLNLGMLSISGEFALGNDNCSGQAVAPSNTCTFGVTFSPLSTGAKNGQVSIPSNAATFVDHVALGGTGVDHPILYEPSNGDPIHTLRPAFDWSDYPGASSYHIQVSRNAAFTLVAINRLITVSFLDAPVNLTANITYYWRVRARVGLAFTPWSDVWTFTTPNPPSTPQQVSPANGTLVSAPSPLFDWKDATIPSGTTFDHYQIQIATDNAFNNRVHDVDVAASQDNSAILDPARSYYWRVRAFNTAGDYSAWSTVRLVKTRYAPPILLLPADGSTASSLRPTFTWGAISGATSYTIQISTNNTFASVLIARLTTTTSFTMPVNTVSGQTYYWRVMGSGLYGPGDWSLVFSFIAP